jgi:hypothetical protein
MPFSCNPECNCHQFYSFRKLLPDETNIAGWSLRQWDDKCCKTAKSHPVSECSESDFYQARLKQMRLGLRTEHKSFEFLVEEFWKTPPQKVIVL